MSDKAPAQMRFEGTIVDLNKETLTGTFRTTDGVTFRFRYEGDDPEGLFLRFGEEEIVIEGMRVVEE